MSSDISHRIPLTMRLQPLRMRLTHDLRVGVNFFPHIWIPGPRFTYLLYNLYGSTIKTNWGIRQNSVRPCVKDHTLCACTKSRQSWTLKQLAQIWCEEITSLSPMYYISLHHTHTSSCITTVSSPTFTRTKFNECNVRTTNSLQCFTLSLLFTVILVGR